MIGCKDYLDRLIEACRAAFGGRLLYVGLQGSYLRGEAREDSDIDVMLVLEGLSVEDMDTYRAILERVGDFEKSCGFLCGREELRRWNRLEVCQLLHTTRDLVGRLADYLPPAKREDEISYVELSLGNLYHELCHRYVHSDTARREAGLRSAGKGLFFLIQNLYYLESGDFVLTRKELKERVCPQDGRMLEVSELPEGFDHDRVFPEVIAWCQEAFGRTERLRKEEGPFGTEKRRCDTWTT